MAEGTILILGATGAVGAALARRVAARGLRPALVALDARRLAAPAAASPGLLALPADVEDPAAPRGPVPAAAPPLAGPPSCVGLRFPCPRSPGPLREAAKWSTTGPCQVPTPIRERRLTLR